MKNVLLIFMLFGIFACAKQENTEITTTLTGTIKCINDNRLDGMTVTALDTTGIVISTTTTNALGEFTFTGLEAGDYQIHASSNSNYVYSDAEYDAIIADLWSLVLGGRSITKQDLLAYHMIDFQRLSTLDIVYFEKVKLEDYNINDLMPWRLIKVDDYNSNNLTAADIISVTVEENMANNVDILTFYYGDPLGSKCL